MQSNYRTILGKDVMVAGRGFEPRSRGFSRRHRLKLYFNGDLYLLDLLIRKHYCSKIIIKPKSTKHYIRCIVLFFRGKQRKQVNYRLTYARMIVDINHAITRLRLNVNRLDRRIAIINEGDKDRASLIELRNSLSNWIIELERIRERLYTLMELRTISSDLKDASRQLKELRSLIANIAPEAGIYMDRVIRSLDDILY